MAYMIIARDDPVRVLATIGNIEAIPRVGDKIQIEDTTLLAGGDVGAVVWKVVNVAARKRKRRRWRPAEWRVEVWVWLV